MKNKLWFVLLVAAILVFTTITVTKTVKAESNTSDINESEDVQHDMDNAEIMHTGLGAKVRLLELDKSVTRNYIYGQHVITQITANNYTANITKLQDIVDQLGILKGDIDMLVNSTLTNDTVKQFVDYKDQAITLTKEFRDELNAQLTIEQRHAIRDSVDKQDFTQVADLNKDILHTVWQFNSDRALAILTKLGVTDQTILDKVKTGNLTADQLKTLLKDVLNNLTTEQKQNLNAFLKEEGLQKLAMRKKVFDSKVGNDTDTNNRFNGIFNDKSLPESERAAKIKVLLQDKMQQKLTQLDQQWQQKRQDIMNRFEERFNATNRTNNGAGWMRNNVPWDRNNNTRNETHKNNETRTNHSRGNDSGNDSGNQGG